MLKFKINQKTYDALSDEMKTEYLAGDADGEFVLDVADLPKGEDVGPVKRALESEKGKVKTLKGELDAAKATIAEMPDVAALTANHEKEVTKYKAFTEDSLKNGVATAMATKISTTPSLLSKEIAARLVVDMTGDKPVTKVLGLDGKVSDMTVEKLSEEFVANKEYAAIMIGSKASGGGAPRVPVKTIGGGAPNGEQNNGQQPDYSAMKPADLASHVRAKIDARNAAATAT